MGATLIFGWVGVEICGCNLETAESQNNFTMIIELEAFGRMVNSGKKPYSKYVLPSDKIKGQFKAKKGDSRKPNYRMQAVLFNVDEQCIELPDTEPYKSKDEQAWEKGAVNFGPPSGKKHYPAVLFPKNHAQWEASLFIREDGKAADLLQWAGEEIGADLQAALLAIMEFSLQKDDGFEQESLFEAIQAKSSTNSPIVLIYAAISWEEKGWDATPLARIDNFKQLYELSRAGKASSKKQENNLCFFSNEVQEDANAPNSTNRYNLNKVFVTTTFNYASNFDKNAFDDGFSLGSKAFDNLEAGSEFLLQNGGALNEYIAGITHVVIPSIPGGISEDTYTDRFVETIKGINYSLFHPVGLKELTEELKELEDTNNQLFGLTYLAFDSDGNSTKIISTIREVSNFQFTKIIRDLKYVNLVFRSWLGSEKVVINLFTLFTQLPIPPKAKKNIGLALITNILEGRKVDDKILFHHFCEVMNCHRYDRYGAYDYPKKFGDGDVIWRYVKTVVYYSALRLMLFRLGQLRDPHFSSSPTTLETINQFLQPEPLHRMENDIQQYFDRLGYTSRQQALFHLGRALSSVGYAQDKKENSRTIMNSLDFNGMNRRKIENLATNILGKASLYRMKDDNGNNKKASLLDAVTSFQMKLFFENLDSPNWEQIITLPDGTEEPPVGEKEAVFFIMAGYTYGAKKTSPEPENIDGKDV